jgi:hypothetical protein
MSLTSTKHTDKLLQSIALRYAFVRETLLRIQSCKLHPDHRELAMSRPSGNIAPQEKGLASKRRTSKDVEAHSCKHMPKCLIVVTSTCTEIHDNVSQMPAQQLWHARSERAIFLSGAQHLVRGSSAALAAHPL